jgi:hypothetical protein
VAEAPRFGLKAGTRPEQPSAQSTFDLLSPPADRPMSNEGSSGKNGGTGGAWSGKLGGSER